MERIKIIECPRDAMQGIDAFIPTEIKAEYLRSLLRVGFHTIDFGSFVSPKAIPQLRDSSEVLNLIPNEELQQANLLAIVANERGAEDALEHEVIDFLGFPLSLSETFQQRNTRKSIEEAFAVVNGIQTMVNGTPVKQVVYLSMGFGNPYGDPWNEDYIRDFIEKLIQMDVKIISLADTIGNADRNLIERAFGNIIPEFSGIEFGAHLHSRPDSSLDKIRAAWDSGCRRFDGAIRGFGGCPMAEDELVGNIDTKWILSLGKEKNAMNSGFSEESYAESLRLSSRVFG